MYHHICHGSTRSQRCIVEQQPPVAKRLTFSCAHPHRCGRDSIYHGSVSGREGLVHIDVHIIEGHNVQPVGTRTLHATYLHNNHPPVVILHCNLPTHPETPCRLTASANLPHPRTPIKFNPTWNLTTRCSQIQHTLQCNFSSFVRIICPNYAAPQSLISACDASSQRAA